MHDTCGAGGAEGTIQGMEKRKGTIQFYLSVLAVAVPMMLEQLITNSVNLVDNLMVGTLGDAAIGSVAAVNRYYMIASYAAMGLSAAGGVFIAQYRGANEEEHMKESFRTMLLFNFLIIGLFTSAALLYPSSILSFFTRDPRIIHDGVIYLSIAAWSFLPMAVMMSVYSSMRSIGETRVPLRCSIISIFANVILNYCLIFGAFGFPRLELRGAAAATLLARLIELCASMVFLRRGNYAFKTSLADLFRIPRELGLRVLSKAAPLMLNETLWAGGMATLFKLYCVRGSDVMSGYSIACSIGDLFFMMLSGMAAAATVFISIPLGAGNKEEARENAYRLLRFSMALAVVLGIFIWLSRSLVPILYSGVSAGAQKVAADVLGVQACLFWIYMGGAQCYFTLRAGGDMRHTLIMDSGFMWAFAIPAVAFTTYCTNLPYLWPYVIGELTEIVKLIFAFRLVKREEWLVNLTETEDEQ